MFLTVLALLASLSDAPAAGPTTPPALTVQQVMERVHARARANEIVRNGIAYIKHKTVFDVDEAGERVHESLVWRMWIRDNVTWQQMTTKNGKPRNGKPEPPDANLAAGLISWYTFRLDEKPIQPEPKSGIPCWVVHFTPSGQGTPNGLMEEVASRMKGTMYVDSHGFWIRSASGSLPEPYRKFLVINAQRVNFTLVQSEELGAVITRKLDVQFWYSVLGSNSAQRHEYVYESFTLDVPAPAP